VPVCTREAKPGINIENSTRESKVRTTTTKKIMCTYFRAALRIQVATPALPLAVTENAPQETPLLERPPRVA